MTMRTSTSTASRGIAIASVLTVCIVFFAFFNIAVAGPDGNGNTSGSWSGGGPSGGGDGGAAGLGNGFSGMGGEGSGGGAGGWEGAELVTLADFLSELRALLNTFIPFIIGLAVLVILWGIFTYISHAAEEEKRREAKQFVLYGIIGVFLMLSIWGFINILVNTFNLEKTIKEGAIPQVPAFQLGAEE